RLVSRPQVEGKRELPARFERRRKLLARRVAELVEARHPAPLRFQAIAWKRLVGEPPGVRHMVRASGDRAVVPAIEEIEDQRRVYPNGGVERRGRLPGAVANTSDQLTVGPGGVERHSPTVDRDD